MLAQARIISFLPVLTSKVLPTPADTVDAVHGFLQRWKQAHGFADVDTSGIERDGAAFLGLSLETLLDHLHSLAKGRGAVLAVELSEYLESAAPPAPQGEPLCPS